MNYCSFTNKATPTSVMGSQSCRLLFSLYRLYWVESSPQYGFAYCLCADDWQISFSRMAIPRTSDVSGVATWMSSMHLNLNVWSKFWSPKSGQSTHPPFPVLTNDTTIPSEVQVPDLMVSLIQLSCTACLHLIHQQSGCSFMTEWNCPSFPLQLPPLVQAAWSLPWSIVEPSGTLSLSCPLYNTFSAEQTIFTETTLFCVSFSLGTSHLLCQSPDSCVSLDRSFSSSGTTLLVRPALSLSQGLCVGHSLWLKCCSFCPSHHRLLPHNCIWV